ncbi:uncharacterized protein LOC111711905 [Eurytemora carolleeae]|uniref:uncharacterized protein LOC111711905 n=1 Tax=Eurytemora carolleeae TaxID=1294199 RepID=UPI000C774667|nr:uncharacterized protein LOC111711905 [Eurytemora carolleeae]|eukprot:XP_023342158.1 uncharacterized protein LOC111711905 [Eurytemora affinis]
MSRFKSVKCVLFDMDGLILDTENLYTLGTQTILQEYGKEYSWEFKAKLMGKRTDEVARMIIEHYQLPLKPEQWIQRSTEVYQQLFPNVKSLPGVSKLVHHLAKHNIPIAIATSSSTSAFEMKTRNHSGLFSLFDLIIKGDNPEVRRAKPSPDIFLLAASKLNIAPEDCLVVEDAPLGVQAGLDGGMQVLMVPDYKLDPEHAKLASHSVQHLHQFDPKDFGLPSFGYKPVTHIIFDMDGLLLNTMNMYSEASARILGKHGKQSDWNFKMKVIGRKYLEVATMAVEHYELPYTPEEYLRLHQEETFSMFPTCELLPGAEKLIRHLHARNIPIAVATSSTRDVMEMKTKSKHSEIFSLFSHIVTGCDPEVIRGKPSPDIFEVCRTRFKDAPYASQCLVFEDAPNGVEAGIAAGMQVVMIPHHKVTKEHLLPATQLLPSLLDFQPQDFNLPSF